MKQRLAGAMGKDIVKCICHYYYPHTRKMPDYALISHMFSEVTIRERNDKQTNRFGGEKPDHYRFDAVLAVKPGRDAINQNSVFTVGIELKGTIEDLRADKKFTHYRGWTNLLFFAVPKALVAVAEEKVEFYDDIGVIDIENGFVCKYPRMCTVPLNTEVELLKQLLYNYM